MEARGVHICQPRQGSACIQIKVEEAHHDQLEMEVSTFEPANHPSNLCFSVEKMVGYSCFGSLHMYLYIYTFILLDADWCRPPKQFLDPLKVFLFLSAGS